ncbi:MAG: glycosyltransferase [Verrucomicrobia bacterium]|nr:glycosyltransferase [Verrucomicrobiota bacterium]MBI3867117.1 glycosyltransferase [Verrucomicrobiota bacterium]
MISVVTPSFRQLGWLKLCAASVADQSGADFEHIVQDAGSGPELEAWAATRPSLRLVAEKDRGMYDAINRGLAKSRGEICAYLNCDEQYLPGALSRVDALFDAHPEVDIFFANAHVVDPLGGYICTRHALIPQTAHTMVSNNLAILTCGTFFRRRLLEERQLYFDTAWRNVGDAVWALSLIRKKVRMGLCGFATSTFTDTGENMNLNAEGHAERRKLFQLAPSWARWLSPLVVAHFRCRKFLKGHYRGEPVRYEIYTTTSPDRRVRFDVARGTARWKTRM